MILKVTDIEDTLKDFWPELEFKWFWDTQFTRARDADIDRLIENSKLKDMQFVPQKFDCNKFAHQFVAEVDRIRYFAWEQGRLSDDEFWPYAMFFVAGDMFRGIEKLHAVALTITESGIWLIDMTPAERRKWLADKEQDNIYFLESL